MYLKRNRFSTNEEAIIMGGVKVKVEYFGWKSWVGGGADDVIHRCVLQGYLEIYSIYTYYTER